MVKGTQKWIRSDLLIQALSRHSAFNVAAQGLMKCLIGWFVGWLAGWLKYGLKDGPGCIS